MTERQSKRGNKDIQAVEIIPVEYDPDRVLAMLDKIVEYDHFVQTARDLNITVPVTRPTREDDNGLRQVHHALFEFHVIEGILHCPKCNQQYTVSNGIPDFVLP